MFGPVFVLDPSLTSVTLLGLYCASLLMLCKVLLLELFGAIPAWFGPKFAHLLMIFEFRLQSLITAILALDINVLRLLMFFFLTLGDDHATLFALVAQPGTLYLMHPILACLNLAFTIFTQFRLFCRFSHFYYTTF